MCLNECHCANASGCDMNNNIIIYNITRCFIVVFAIFLGYALKYVMVWGDMMHLASLFVCLSVRTSVSLSLPLYVCPSRGRVRSISMEPLVGYTNRSAQMSCMISRCEVRMFDQCRFKVKVIGQS